MERSVYDSNAEQHPGRRRHGLNACARTEPQCTAVISNVLCWKNETVGEIIYDTNYNVPNPRIGL